MHFVQVSSHVRCAVEDLCPNGSPTILMLHGWPLSHRIFEYICNAAPALGVRCITMDLRGYGASDKPFSGYNYDRLADDVCAVCRSIDAPCITLLGFSMGGAVAIRYMARHQGYKVNQLILCGAAAPVFTRAPENPRGLTREAVDLLIRESYQDRPAMTKAFGTMCFAQPHSAAFMDWFQDICLDAGGPATIHSLEALRDERLYSDLKTIRTPTLILHGKRDQVCPFELAETMHDGIISSFLVPFEESGHCLFIDEREKFNNEVTEFVLVNR